MPGTRIEHELYSSFTARARLAEVDDGDVDSPVLGMWADVEERRVGGRKTGEWTLDVGNDGPQGAKWGTGKWAECESQLGEGGPSKAQGRPLARDGNRGRVCMSHRQSLARGERPTLVRPRFPFLPSSRPCLCRPLPRPWRLPPRRHAPRLSPLPSPPSVFTAADTLPPAQT